MSLSLPEFRIGLIVLTDAEVQGLTAADLSSLFEEVPA